jgi:hypothetical protein
MNADSTVRRFVCCWANATADSATGGYRAEALGLRTSDFIVDRAKAGVSWRYHGLCPWGSIGLRCFLKFYLPLNVLKGEPQGSPSVTGYGFRQGEKGRYPNVGVLGEFVDDLYLDNWVS